MKTFVILAASVISFGFSSLCMAENNATPKEEIPASSQQCLACHGSFNDLIKKNVKFTNEWGVTVNPHAYIDKLVSNPHNGNKVPDCLGCHQKHPLPMPSGWKASHPANISTCYGCHHLGTFKPCESCHFGFKADKIKPRP